MTESLSSEGTKRKKNSLCQIVIAYLVEAIWRKQEEENNTHTQKKQHPKMEQKLTSCSSVVELTLITPARWNAASKTSSEPANEPVCDRAAFAAA